MSVGMKKLVLAAVLAVLGAGHIFLVPDGFRLFSFGALVLVAMVGAFVIGWTSPVEPGSMAGRFGGGESATSMARRMNPMAFDDEASRGVSFDDSHAINPASGLPMVGSVDIHGNPLGTDHSSMH